MCAGAVLCCVVLCCVVLCCVVLCCVVLCCVVLCCVVLCVCGLGVGVGVGVCLCVRGLVLVRACVHACVNVCMHACVCWSCVAEQRYTWQKQDLPIYTDTSKLLMHSKRQGSSAQKYGCPTYTRVLFGVELLKFWIRYTRVYCLVSVTCLNST